MKITNPEVIKSGEHELIDAITADIDWGVIEEIFKKEYKLGIEEDVEYKRGDIVIHNDQIAYEMEFEVKVTLAVILDREGNYISVTSSSDLEKIQAENGEQLSGDQKELEGKNEGGLEAEPEKPEPEPVDGYEEALSELNLVNAHKKSDMMPSLSSDDNPQDKISQMAAEAGEMIEEMGEEK